MDMHLAQSQLHSSVTGSDIRHASHFVNIITWTFDWVDLELALLFQRSSIENLRCEMLLANLLQKQVKNINTSLTQCNTVGEY